MYDHLKRHQDDIRALERFEKLWLDPDWDPIYGYKKHKEDDNPNEGEDDMGEY